MRKIFDRISFTCEYFRYCVVLNPVVSVSCEQNLLLSVKDTFPRYRIYLEGEKEKKADIEAKNQKAIISNKMAKLKDQYDAIKRAISIME